MKFFLLNLLLITYTVFGSNADELMNKTDDVCSQIATTQQEIIALGTHCSRLEDQIIRLTHIFNIKGDIVLGDKSCKARIEQLNSELAIAIEDLTAAQQVLGDFIEEYDILTGHLSIAPDRQPTSQAPSSLTDHTPSGKTAPHIPDINSLQANKPFSFAGV